MMEWWGIVFFRCSQHTDIAVFHHSGQPQPRKRRNACEFRHQDSAHEAVLSSFPTRSEFAESTDVPCESWPGYHGCQSERVCLWRRGRAANRPEALRARPPCSANRGGVGRIEDRLTLLAFDNGAVGRLIR